jgi:ATP-dependent Clp protease ATP-binding subunit ClpC
MEMTPQNEPNPVDLPFNEPARRLLAAAHDESSRLHHEYIGTEHLVLALTRQSDDASLLALLGLDQSHVRALIDGTIAPGRAAPMSASERPYTSRTHKVFSFAVASARTLGHRQVGLEHLLVGLLQERLNIGAQALAQCGLTLERAADQARQVGDES